MKTNFYKSTFSNTGFSLCLFLLTLFLSWSTIAQTQNNGRTNLSLKGAKEIKMSSVEGIPAYVSFNENERPSFTNFEKWLQTNLELSGDFGIQLINSDRDMIGFTHYRYIQTYKGIPINRTMILVHVQNNAVASFNGEMISKISGGTIPTVTPSTALNKAKEFIGAKSYKWEILEEESFIKKEQGDANATFFPKAELVFSKSPNGEYKLAFRFDIYAHQPVSRNYVFVDAVTGEILGAENRIFEADTPGTAITGYSGTQTITTDFTGATYRLRETGRGLGIETYNMNNDSNFAAATDFIDADNTWNNVNAAKDQYATDAHFGAEKTYDYYFNTFSRNSVDNAGEKIRGYVHTNLVLLGYPNNINAHWDGNRMWYGDGGSGYNVLTAVDIVAHELTHGVTEHTANFYGSYEGGSLHEGFSDIFGTTIEFFATPGQADWTLAEDIGTPFRSMSNPNLYGQPDTYRGNNWYYGQGDHGGVHQNDGVLNYWYYLLTQGGSGTNDIGSAYSVTGIGMTKAAAIAYRTLTVYLFPSAQYADARFYAIKSAEDLYGVCSAEATATAAAWYAVGIGDLVAGNAPTISTGGITGFCSGSSQIINASAAANYQWNKNGVAISGATNSSYAATTSAFYTVTTNYCSTAFTSSSIYLTAYTAQVAISSSTTSSCNGGSILLSSSASSGYQMQWNKNGVPIAGATNSTYSATVSGNYTATISGTTIPASIFSNSGSVSIPNYTCTGVNDAIAVSGLPSSISTSGISLVLDITHPHDSDLVIWLEAPNGDKLGLSYMNGGINGANFTNTVFSDAAFNQLPLWTGAPFTGTYRAMPSVFTICGANTTNRTSFTGIGYGSINPNGNWKLHIVDIRPTNVGTLNSWSINFRSIQTPNPNCGPVTSNQISLSITNAVPPAITPSGPTTFCQGGSVYLTASSGASYLWSTGGTTQSIFVTSSGTYSVYVTDVAGCVGSAFQTVTVNSLPIASIISAGGPTSFCQGGSVTLSGNTTGGTWSVVGGNAASISASSAGDYFVTTTNSCGSTTSNHITVTVNSLPIASVITAGGPTTFCLGGSVTLSGNTTGGTWSVGGGNTATLIATASGDYFVTTTNSCGSTTSNHITVTVNPSPSAVVTGSTVYCGNANGTVTNVVSGGTAPYTYLWSTGASTQNISSLAAGNYAVTITDLNGCSFSNAAAVVNGGTALSVTLNSSSATCGQSNGAVTNTINGGTSPFIFAWSNGATTQNLSNVPAGNYAVTVTDAFGCQSNSSATVSSTGNAPAQPTFSTTQLYVCRSQTGFVYSVLAVNGATSYLWTTSNGATISSGQGTTSVTVSFSASATSSTITCAAVNGCGNSTAASFAYTIATAKPAVPGTMSGNTINCANTTATFSVAAVAYATTYTWTIPANTTIISGQGTNSISLSFGAAWVGGTVSVNASNCIGTSANRSKAIRGIPATPASITGPISGICNATGVGYSTAAVSYASSYTWTVPSGVTIASGQGTTAITVDFNASFLTGAISVTADNSCGASAARTVTVKSAPATPGTITGLLNNICLAGNQTYSIAPVFGATSYTWTVPTGTTIISGQGTTSVLLSFPSGFLVGNISVYASNTCANSASKTITVYARPATPGTITGTNPVCANQAGVNYSVAAVTGATSYTWTVPTGATIASGQGTIAVSVNFGSTAGNVTVKAANSCASSPVKSLTITMNCRLDESVIETDFSVYPNPTDGLFTVEISNPENFTTLKIENILGQTMLTKNMDGESSISIQFPNEVAKGVYIIHLIGENAIVSKQIVLQ